MNIKLFNLLLELNAIQNILKSDGNKMQLKNAYGAYNVEELKEMQEEVTKLSVKENEILNALRDEILNKEESKTIKKSKIRKKEVTIRSNGRKKG